jgi:hypothetical protein
VPEFCSPFTVLKSDRKLAHEELVRATRLLFRSMVDMLICWYAFKDSLPG